VQEAEGVEGADPDPGDPQRKRDRVVKLAGKMAQKGRDFWIGRPGGIRQSIRKTLGNLVGGEERRNQTNGALGDVGKAEEDTSSQGLRHDEDSMEPKEENYLKTIDPSTARRRAAKRKHLALTRSLPRPALPSRPGTAQHNSTQQRLDAATQEADGPKGPNAVVQRTCMVPAPLEVCVAVASDLDSYSQWCHSGLKRIDVLERVESSGQASLVRMDVGKYGQEPVVSWAFVCLPCHFARERAAACVPVKQNRHALASVLTRCPGCAWGCRTCGGLFILPDVRAYTLRLMLYCVWVQV
jgi:hypothetical protein